MQVKLVKDNQKQFFQCQHVCVTVFADDMFAVKTGLATPGISIELSPGPTLNLPQDGDSAYLLNDSGKTIDAYHWPIRTKNSPDARHTGDAEAHSPSR